MDKESNIFVAGSSGMVGSAVVRNLKKNGYKKIILTNSSNLDLTNQERTDNFFQKTKIDFVFLCAARVGGILENSKKKAEFIYNNLQIQNNVIHSAYLSGVQKLLFLGSSCIYPKKTLIPIKEDQLLSGKLEPTNDAYAIAKISGIKLCDSYREQYGFNAISLMPTNLYGPKDNFDLKSSHVIPALIRKFCEAKRYNLPQVECWGSGNPKREFLHVDDLADACVFMMKNYSDYGHINVGTGIDISISELALKIKKMLCYEGEIVWDKSKPDGTARKVLDVTKINNFGWKHRIDLDQGLRETIDWYEKNIDQG